MDKRIIYRLVEEVRQQARFGRARFQALRLRLNEPDHEKVFLEVHALLGHVGMLSRLLWPERTASAERGKALRGALQVPEDSPLRMSGVREQVTGLDEPFEDWLMTVPEGGYVDMNLMPAGTMMGSKEDVFQRNLDPDTLMFQLRGVPLDLRKLADAIRGVETATQQWLKTHQPW